MSMQNTIQTKLTQALAPSWIEVVDESHTHNVPKGSESHFNVFVVSDGVLVTPPVDGRILAGITRSHMMDLADELGIPVEIRPVHADERVDEIYVSSTLKELTAVDELNGTSTSGSGPVGRQLMSEFRGWAREHCLT